MRVAVTGTSGRVGGALARHFSTRHEVIPLPRKSCDLADSASLARALGRLDCDVFLHPAAITSLEACEDDPALAMQVNAEAPGTIAVWAAVRGVPVYYFSTDYVFGGLGDGLCKETDIPEPLSVYGRSKLAGERAVLAGSRNCVIRVSWVFGPEKPSFVDQIFAAAVAGQPLAAIADKFSLPVFTGDLAVWTEQLILAGTSGTVHACNSGEPTSWHGMALAVVEKMAACGILKCTPTVTEQRLAEMTSFRAARPRFTALDTRRLAGILDHPPRLWRDALADYVRYLAVRETGSAP